MEHSLLASKQASKARLNYLDFYKGICIVFIIITHYAWEPEQRRILFFPFWIDMAVPIFMVITGYLNSMVFERKRWCLRDAYKLRGIVGKWMRFVIPFVLVYFIQVVSKIADGQSISAVGLIKNFLVGGYGPGSYYFPIMIQVILIIPLIWYVIQKYKAKGLIGCFLLNAIFEFVKTAIGMPVTIYRLCAFRYIFILGYGSYLYVCHDEIRNQKKIWFYLAGCVGILYLVAFKYLGVEFVVVPEGWTSTFVIGVLYIVPIMLHAMRPNGLKYAPLELLGKASFNIFLVQMFYYWGICRKIYLLVPTRILQVLLSIIICCSVGIAFYKIENPITQRIVRRIRATGREK